MTLVGPSSATAGFFQQAPVLLNAFEDDKILNNIIQFYLPDDDKTHEEMRAFAQEVIKPEIFDLIADAEQHPPTVSTHSTFGKSRTKLITSYGWRRLQEIGIEAGIVAMPYENAAPSRMTQFIKYHIWSSSAAVVTCPSAMTDGAATLMRRQLSKNPSMDPQQRAVFEEAYSRLTSRDPNSAWTSGQWMTERPGGSDVSGTETIATYAGPTSQKDANNMPLGPYLIHGFKWFSSATDSQMTVLLAQLDGKLTTFFAPMRRVAGDGSIEMNGVSIQRLKAKLGTRALPTAELVIDGMRAWMIGKPGDGIREISAILNITRIHNALSALSFWGRALGISRAFARVRKARGKLLQDVPAHAAGIARNTVDYAGHMHLGFLVVALFDVVERPESLKTSAGGNSLISSPEEAGRLLRLLTPVAKAQCSKRAIFGIQECMESLGGVGYVEDEQYMNVARLFRDANVLSIWEGTTTIMADDVVRVIKGRDGQKTCEVFLAWVRTRMSSWTGAEGVRARIENALQAFEDLAAQAADEIRFQGTKLLELLAWVTGSVMLQEATKASHDESTVAIAAAWLSRSPSDSAINHAADALIAFGNAGSSEQRSKL